MKNKRNRLLGKRFSLWYEEKLKNAYHAFSKSEKGLFFLFSIVLAVSSLGLLWSLNNLFLVEVPAHEGMLAEGVIGAPRFINPLLAISDTDRDLTTLVYSGLMRVSPDGTLALDLAESYTISDDGLSYTFTLKEDLVWHDGENIMADDVVFTIEKVQDKTLKSPRFGNWDGVTVEKLSDRVVAFHLKQPYAPFLENTTLGILPRHIWAEADTAEWSFSQFNIDPIGSGPYKVSKIKRDSSGVPEYYDFTAFKHFALGRPYITALRIHFYSNEDSLLSAYNKEIIDSMSTVSSKKAAELRVAGSRVETAPLPRVFALFFNRNQAPIFADQSAREAVNTAIDREGLVRDVLFGYATAIRGPLPPGSLGYTALTLTSEQSVSESEEQDSLPSLNRIERAKAILEDGGWKVDEEDGLYKKKKGDESLVLSFALSTSDAPELKAVAEKVQAELRAMGAQVDLKIFDTSDLNQNVIRPRKFDVLLFGEILGRDPDPFAFWHSSQRLDPGLNIASYTSITADKLLEDARVTSDRDVREKKYQEFVTEIEEDTPAVFLYSPDFLYVVPNDLGGIALSPITVSSERFANIHTWFVVTEKVWKIFADKQ